MSCNIVPSALPHFENKSLEMIYFLKKAIKGKQNKKQKEIKNNFPKLTYKDWDFFLDALVFRVPEQVDLKTNQKKRKINHRGFYLLCMIPSNNR